MIIIAAMKCPRLGKILSLSLGLLCLGSPLSAGIATAASVSVTYSYGLPLNEHAPEVLELGMLPKFNRSLGALTGATLEVFGSATAQITLTNNSASAINASALVTTHLIWNSGLAPLNDLMGSQNNIQSIPLSTGTLTPLDPGQTMEFGALHADGSLTFDLTPILPFLQTFGNGSFDLTLQSLIESETTGGDANLGTLLNLTSGGGASITYSYIPPSPPPVPPVNVPEPGAALLSGLALLGLVARRRR